MEKILFRIHLKNGKKSEKLYESTKEWMADFKVHEVLKIEDVKVNSKTKKPKVSELSTIKGDLILLITKRSKNDIDLSKECGYTVTYKKPSFIKVFKGMKFLEASDDFVLEAELDNIVEYNKEVHTYWKGPGYKPNEEWSCTIFHINSNVIPREEAEKLYGKLKGTQGGISYLKIK
jgi:hypothetical protein